MTPEEWQRLEALVSLALEHPAAERARALANANADESLIEEALALARECDTHPEYLDEPLINVAAIWQGTERDAAQTMDHVPEPWPNVGDGYRITARIGAGGMAEVYRAERDVDGMAQAVAIKVLRRGIETSEMLRRFSLERRILASLSHPSIARLLDTGSTEDGRPFVVMDLVEGITITAWCDQQQLGVAARVQLCLDVCAAVQHAHQHFVVHRDIKPSNILVSAAGRPTLLDFGIGKVLHEGSIDSGVETIDAGRLLTPDYASPEQLTGGPVTTATDVYALGLLCYELLSGRHPLMLRNRSREELERVVLSETAEPLDASVTAAHASARSTNLGALRRTLHGDLDLIVRMALRKEPERRYPTVTAFADDLRRWRERRPVLARDDTLVYRAQRFVGRHTAGVVAAVLGATLVFTSTALVFARSRAVDHSAQRVAAQRDRAREVRNFLLETFGASGADRSVGDTVSVKRLLDLQVTQAALQYADQPELRADMLEALAEAYERLGVPTEAEPLAREAVALRVAADPASPATLPDALPASLNLHGWILHVLGRSAEGEPLLLTAIVQRRSDPDARAGLSRSLNDLGVLYNAVARYADAETVLTEALALRETLPGMSSRQVGITANNLAAAHYYQGRYADAARVQERAVDALITTFGRDHQRTIVGLSNLATFRLQAGDRDGAAAEYRRLLDRQSRLQGPEHHLTAHAMILLAAVQFDRAVLQDDSVALREADTLTHNALTVFQASFGAQHPQVGRAQHQRAMVLQQLGLIDSALIVETRAVRTLSATSGALHPSTLVSRHARVRLLRASGQPANADAELRRIATTLEQAPDSTPGIATERARAAAALCDARVASISTTGLQSAVSQCERAVQALAPLPPTVDELRTRMLTLRDSVRKLATGG